MLCGAVFIVYTLAPQTIGETARREFIRKLVDHYPNHKISIRRGHFKPDLGLIFEDIRIADQSNDSFLARSREMVRIERLTLVSDIQPEKLLDKQIPMTTKRIVIEGVEVSAWLKGDGKISVQDLMPLPNFGPAVPRIDLHRTKIRLLDPATRGRPIVVNLSDILFRNITGADGDCEQQVSIQGSADFADDLVAKIRHTEESTDVKAQVKRAFLSRGLFDRLPQQWSELVQHAAGLQCKCDAGLILRYDAMGKLNYKLKTTVHQGQFNHPRLPQPISDLRGVFVCDPTGITVNASHGVLGTAIVRTTGRVDGLRWPCDVDLRLSAGGLMLDDRLAASLPPSIKRAWNKLQPHGRVDIVSAELKHVNDQWDVRASVDCNSVDVRYEKFPYPLESLVGRIEVDNGIAHCDGLSGRIGDTRLQCAFRNPIRPGISNEKSFAIRTFSPVTIDNAMIRALTPRGLPTTSLETFVRSLHPRGTIQLDSAVLTTDADGRPSRSIDLRLVDAHVKYEKFAYPIGNISGKIEINNDLVRLVGCRASNANSGVVTCDGTYKLPQEISQPQSYDVSDGPGFGVDSELDADSELRLNFVATDVPMDQSLRSSLPESTRHVWDSISPSGLLDQLTVQIYQQGMSGPLQLDIEARQRETAQVTNRTLSLRPVSLPYRLDVSGGSVRFDGSKVTIHSLKGRHDASTLAADGQCIQNANGRWELSLDLRSGSRLHPDAQLIAAMPDQVRESMRRLQLRGPISVRGKTRILLPDDSHLIPDIAWNLGLQLEGNRIGDVGPVHSLRGEIAVQGVHDKNGPRAVGQVRIDSMHVDDFQITAIEGPFSLDGDRLLLGSQSRDSLGRGDTPETTKSIEGKLFDGRISIDGNCVLTTGNFLVGLKMDSARVPTALADFGHSDNSLTGTFHGSTKLQGTLGRMDLLNGTGSARLNDANLYQLPFLVQVLNLLRVKPSEDVAFTDGNVDFALDGQTITFTDLQLWGDLVALQGGGTMDRLREVDLTFNTRVSPQNTFSQIVRPLRSKRYTLWTVDVRGPIHSPEIERRALDGVGQTLNRWFPAMADADRDDDTESRKRSSSMFR